MKCQTSGKTIVHALQLKSVVRYHYHPLYVLNIKAIHQIDAEISLSCHMEVLDWQINGPMDRPTDIAVL